MSFIVELEFWSFFFKFEKKNFLAFPLSDVLNMAFIFIWICVVMVDITSEFRLELLYPFWVFLSDLCESSKANRVVCIEFIYFCFVLLINLSFSLQVIRILSYLYHTDNRHASLLFHTGPLATIHLKHICMVPVYLVFRTKFLFFLSLFFNILSCRGIVLSFSRA